MLEALLVGQRDPKVLAELAQGRLGGKRAALVQALTGRFDGHHAELARMLLDQEVPGIGSKAAQVIIAEIGLDMGQFPTPAHLVSWAKLSPAPSSPAPGTAPAPPARATLPQGSPRRSRRRGRQDQPLPRRALPAPGQTPRQAQSPGRRRPIHPGHHLALLADPTARFHDLGADFSTNRTDTDRKTRNHLRQLQALGFTVTLTPRPPDATTHTPGC